MGDEVDDGGNGTMGNDDDDDNDCDNYDDGDGDGAMGDSATRYDGDDYGDRR